MKSGLFLWGMIDLFPGAGDVCEGDLFKFLGDGVSLVYMSTKATSKTASGRSGASGSKPQANQPRKRKAATVVDTGSAPVKKAATKAPGKAVPAKSGSKASDAVAAKVRNKSVAQDAPAAKSSEAKSSPKGRRVRTADALVASPASKQPDPSVLDEKTLAGLRNSAEFRDLMAQTGLTIEAAVELFNRGQAIPVSVAAFKSWLSASGSKRRRNMSDAAFAHAKAVLSAYIS